MVNFAINCKKKEYPCAFIAGYPIHHSKSPKIHNFWLKQYGLQGEYLAKEVKTEKFKSFLISSQKRGFCGGNVTLPYKREAFHLATYKDKVATAVGAVNTLWFEGQKLCATNTDAYGFSANLDEFTPDWVKETALVFGAGGAARAVLYILKKRGFERIFLFNRTRQHANDLAEYFGKPIEVYDWHNIYKILYQVDLIVNATSVDMINLYNKQKDVFFDFHKVKPTALITDVVYTPLITPFLQQAKAHGLKTVDGLGMLLHQAVPGFERWFGIRPLVTKALRTAIVEDMSENKI
ncbi:shikimate dehydrogenase [Bartonella sp. WD12.1]|uniref:shikimate dehydrogenase n=1 Tax=Bartonella sp. WD12.1 TaxID=1933903 RepID=UPI00099A7308|nr:shikimate dehydrogenase [Bartonella sp. WD12.1]OPB30375.1 shikimate dehydrogenase [Bartonella sp. WD12.1]